jgi:hypothetical protein
MPGRNLLLTLGAGAGLMYFLDPAAGKKRRKMFAYQCARMQRDFTCFLDKGLCDLTNRVDGVMAETRGILSTDQHCDDRVLHDRVRSKLGRYVSHPRAIHIEANDGVVRLRGHVLSSEVTPLVSALRTLRGVKHLDNQLEVHTEPDIAALQGGAHRSTAHGLFSPGAFAPGTQLALGAASAVLMLMGAAARRPFAFAMGAGGLGALCASCAASGQARQGNSTHGLVSHNHHFKHEKREATPQSEPQTIAQRREEVNRITSNDSDPAMGWKTAEPMSKPELD